MPKLKIYTCSSCGEEFEPEELVRIRKELYGIGNYRQFSSSFFVDLCDKCYDKLLYELLEVTLDGGNDYEKW